MRWFIPWFFIAVGIAVSIARGQWGPINRNDLQRTLQMLATCIAGFAAGQYLSGWLFHLPEWISLYLFVGGVTLMVGARAITAAPGKERMIIIGTALVFLVIGIVGFWGRWEF